MNNKLLVVSLLAVVAVMSGCSSSKSSTPAVELDNAPPNGIWEVIQYNSGEQTTTSGTVVITPTSLVEYYDFDNGSDCNLDFTTKYDNDWDEMHESFATGWSVTLTPTENADQTLFAFYDSDVAPQGTATLQYKGEVTASTIADLNARTCGVDVNGEFPNGIWKSTTRDRFDSENGDTFGRLFGGGVILTTESVTVRESHQFDDRAFTDDACYHAYEATFSSWPNILTVAPQLLFEWEGSFNDGMTSTVTENGTIEEHIYYEYVGPVTNEAVAAFTAEFSNFCTHDGH